MLAKSVKIGLGFGGEGFLSPADGIGLTGVGLDLAMTHTLSSSLK